MKRMVPLIVIAVGIGCAAVPPAKVNVNPRFAQFSIHRVAILPFEELAPPKIEKGPAARGNSYEDIAVSDALTDIFTTEIVSIGAFDFIERSQVRKLFEEKGPSPAGPAREKPITEIGRQLGADAVIQGRVNQLGSLPDRQGGRCMVSFVVRMVDTNTGTVLWTASAQYQQEGRLDMFKAAQEQCASIVSELKRGLAAPPPPEPKSQPKAQPQPKPKPKLQPQPRPQPQAPAAKATKK